MLLNHESRSMHFVVHCVFTVLSVYRAGSNMHKNIALWNTYITLLSTNKYLRISPTDIQKLSTINGHVPRTSFHAHVYV